MKKNGWDSFGIAVSGVCVVHCLMLPVVLSLLPLWPAAEVFHAWLHPIFALILVPTTAIAAVTGFRKHRQRSIVVILAAGLAVILSAGVLGHAAPGATLETALTVAGSALLIGGHWRNWRAARCCDESLACSTHTPHEHAHA